MGLFSSVYFKSWANICQDNLEKSQTADFQPLGRWKTSPQVGYWADPYSKTAMKNLLSTLHEVESNDSKTF